MQRAPGATTSSLMLTHIEQPASRHSKPASRKTWSSPCASAARFTDIEPGTTRARTPERPCGPARSRRRLRRSESRELVQEPMKATSIGMPSSGMPGSSPM